MRRMVVLLGLHGITDERQKLRGGFEVAQVLVGHANGFLLVLLVGLALVARHLGVLLAHTPLGFLPVPPEVLHRVVALVLGAVIHQGGLKDTKQPGIELHREEYVLLAELDPLGPNELLGSGPDFTVEVLLGKGLGGAMVP